MRKWVSTPNSASRMTHGTCVTQHSAIFSHDDLIWSEDYLDLRQWSQQTFSRHARFTTRTAKIDRAERGVGKHSDQALHYLKKTDVLCAVTFCVVPSDLKLCIKSQYVKIGWIIFAVMELLIMEFFDICSALLYHFTPKTKILWFIFHKE